MGCATGGLAAATGPAEAGGGAGAAGWVPAAAADRQPGWRVGGSWRGSGRAGSDEQLRHANPTAAPVRRPLLPAAPRPTEALTPPCPVAQVSAVPPRGRWGCACLRAAAAASLPRGWPGWSSAPAGHRLPGNGRCGLACQPGSRPDRVQIHCPTSCCVPAATRPAAAATARVPNQRTADACAEGE